MNEILYTLFGEGKDLTSLQMGCRTLVMFFVTLALIRLAGMRTFGQKSAFDSIIVIMLGAILSRAVVGASAFIPTVVSGVVLATVHRVIAIACIFNDTLGLLVKGEKIKLYANEKIVKKNLIRCSLSDKDLMEEVRLTLNELTLQNIKEIYMERSGKISIIKKED